MQVIYKSNIHSDLPSETKRPKVIEKSYGTTPGTDNSKNEKNMYE
jgi:hypothetical protein